MMKIFQKTYLSMLVTTLFIMIVGLAMPAQGWAQEKSVTLATMNFEPLYGESLLEGGVVTALTREAFRRVGYRIDVQFMPWKRAIESTKIGDYDGVMGAVLNAERAPFFVATEAIVPYETVLFSRSEEIITYTDLSELKSYKIGTVRGISAEDILKAANLTFESVTEYEQNLKKLMAKRIDLMAGNNFLIPDLLKKYPEFEGKVRAVSPPLQTNPLRILVPKKNSNHTVIVADFNRGLQEIITDGTFNAIVNKYGFSDLAR